MTYLQSILLGFLQGIAEFLPISSSGHLQLVQKLMGLEEVPLVFDVLLHLATLLAVVLYYRKKIWILLCAFGRMITKRPAPKQIKNIDGSKISLSEDEALGREKNLRMYILAIVLATLVTGVIGIFTEKLIGDLPLVFVFIGFLITSFLLVTSSLYEKIMGKKNLKTQKNETTSLSFKKAPSWWQALLIGLSQGIGTLPGISRSGSTISGSLFTGLDRSEAGDFSFIVSIPAILGAFILEAKDLTSVISSIGWDTLLVGFMTAFTSGFLALTWLMKLIKKGRLEWFALYLIPLAICGFIFLC